MINQKMQILVVDDFDSMRLMIRNILVDLGFENITVAYDGEMAKKILESKKIDLIISDWNMPKMNGLELLNYVRANPKLASVPFIMATAEAEKDNIIAAVKSDVSQYIVKPFSGEILAEKIKSAFHRKKASKTSS